MAARSEVRFPVDDNVELGAWLYLPKSDSQRCAAITMTHGYAAVKEHGITRFAEAFADAGFVVLLHDHRTFGVSGGEPRQDVDPWRQIADWRRAISYRESRPAVDSSRIGGRRPGASRPAARRSLAWTPARPPRIVPRTRTTFTSSHSATTRHGKTP